MNRPWQFVLAAALFLLVIVIPGAVNFYVDWLWFGETGYREVYLTTLTTQATVGSVAVLAAFVVLFANVLVALRTLAPRRIVLMTREGPVGMSVDAARVRPIVTSAALVLALLLGVYASRAWQDWLLFRHAQPFGTVDPILGHDVSFYVFSLPVFDAIRGFLFGLLAVATVATGAVYVVAGALSLDPVRGIRLTPAARRHLALLASALFLVLAFGAYLDVPRLLTARAGIIHGVAYTDAAVRIPALRALLAVAIGGSLLLVLQASTARWWPAITAVALYLVTSLAGSAGASVYQRFVVAPNEQVRETPYILHNIEATRAAFALDQVEERELSGDALLTRADIDANDATLGNVRLWDHQPLLQTFSQIQEIRTYYDFVSVHNDRYMIDGQYRQIMLSARELNSQSLPNRNWINERLVFTHGYGVTVGPVNEVTPEGLPTLFVKDIPPQSSVDLGVDEPSLYYGQLSNDHVFVKTNAQEFHYPKGEDNVYTTYEGTGGVQISGLARRLLFSIRFRSFKLLLSEDITRDSRVMYYRQVSERIAKIAPFLRYDEPYLLISNRRLFWLQDGYTTSGRYPYATPAAPGLNYIRNSVKATVDAYHGTVAFYLIDDADPIARTLQGAYPTLFRPLADMPEDMRTRLRYPHAIFAMQAAMYSTYHMTNPAVFYNKEDQWEIASTDTQGTQEIRPYYTMMKLPGGDAPEFIQMLPFTPARKDNLASWMVARSDGDHYGRMQVFQFPKQKVVFGPRQIVARINQDQAISPQITLWNQQGSEVLQGTLLVIPVEESLLYVRPLYLRSAGGRIPELKRVIVAYQNQIVMEETLDRALDRLFGPSGASGPARATPAVTTTSDETTGAGTQSLPALEDALSRRALEHYERALEAQRNGNWALYGEEIKRLGEALQQMSKRP
jgi:hypothetical protein